MRNLFCILLFVAPLLANAQNVWEAGGKPQQKKHVEKKADKVKNEKVLSKDTAKFTPKVEASKIREKDRGYLKGAVPEVDGHVEFDTTYIVPGKTKAELYAFMLRYFTEQTTEEGQLDDMSKVLIQEEENGIVAAKYTEWLVFSKSLLSFDRTKFNYTMIAECKDGQVDLKIKNLSYDYDEDDKTVHYTADEWISDEEAVNKKNTKLFPLSGKFRRKTVDRMRYTFRAINSEIKNL